MQHKLSKRRRAQNQAAEHRQREAGIRKRTIRMPPKVDALLVKLQAAYACTITDVIEGLLLGTIDPRAAHAMAEHGLSQEEARVYVEMSQ